MEHHGFFMFFSPYFPLRAGIPIRTSLDNATTVQYASLMQQLTTKAKCTVRDLDPTNDLSFLRVRTNKHEILIAPGEYNTCKLYPFHIGAEFSVIAL